MKSSVQVFLLVLEHRKAEQLVNKTSYQGMKVDARMTG